MIEIIWIFAEHQDGEITESSLELICEGRRLADLHQDDLVVLLFGYRIETLPKTLSQYGVKKALFVDHERFEIYHPELFSQVLTGMINTYHPDIFLFSSTVVGQDLAPRVAAKLRTYLMPNCDKLEVTDDGLLQQTRLIYQNKVHSTAICPDTKPQMATFLPGIGKVKASPELVEIEIISINHSQFLQPGSKRIEMGEFIRADPKTVDISDADRIVSGGKGLNSADQFQLIWDLADALDASVGGSRVAVDQQWLDRNRQIGQSGKTVSPNLMISCGISGASAHSFGMRDTKTLIAINKDKVAPIMKQADLAVVGDLHEILPELIKQIRDIRHTNS